MLDLFGFSGFAQDANIQMFVGRVSSTSNTYTYHSWVKPRNATNIYIVAIGGGGGGGGGAELPDGDRRQHQSV